MNNLPDDVCENDPAMPWNGPDPDRCAGCGLFWDSKYCDCCINCAQLEEFCECKKFINNRMEDDDE